MHGNEFVLLVQADRAENRLVTTEPLSTERPERVSQPAVDAPLLRPGIHSLERWLDLNG